MLQHHDLFTLYQSFQKACTIALYPELECIWQFDRRAQDNQLPTLSEAVTELAILSEAIEADACRVLSTADFNFFVEPFLKKPLYSNGKSPLTPVSVSSDVDDWLLLKLNQPLELSEFESTRDQNFNEFGQSCVCSSYTVTVCFSDFEVNLEPIALGWLYLNPDKFVPHACKQQQEAILNQLEVVLIEQDEITAQLLEEVSYVVSYAAIVLLLEFTVTNFYGKSSFY